jgi:Zn-dependent peptidase ImmA (M78 family)
MRLSVLRLGARAEVDYLMRNGRDYFSAVTVFGGPRRAILHNDGNARTRQAADIAHEIAHAVLGHPPEFLLSDDGGRRINKVAEAEAEWLGPALLVSEEAAVRVAKSGLSATEAAVEYGVSPVLMQMRLNVTGAPKRARRGR